MFENEFRQPLTVDQAPAGSLCEWCGQAAVQQLSATGGKFHNDSGFFCRSCGEEYARTIADSLNRVITTETVKDLHYAKS
jgi:hypothetical protein